MTHSVWTAVTVLADVLKHDNHRYLDRVRKGKKERQTETERERDTEKYTKGKRERGETDKERGGTDRQTGRDRQTEPNSKTLFYKDCSLGSIKPV